ncbi:hypothetical protein I4U23_000788 [Adineta vaga]|nr:hypothetical protein I4U23_000788 [Adineta vaga]
MGNKATRAIRQIHNALSAERRRKKAQLRRLFDQFDIADMGWLNKTELATMVSTAIRQDPDVHDSRLKRMKLLSWMSPVISSVLVRTMLFDEMDANGDGRVSRKEKGNNVEKNTLKIEFNKLYKTLEYNRVTLEQYEKIIKDQQNYIEQSSKRQTSHLSERKCTEFDDLIINLDIDILPINDNQTKTSLHKKDTIPDNTVDNARYTLIQRQIDDKDEQIRQLRIQLNDIKKTHENELNQYQQKYERIRIELTDNQNAQDQNQRLHHEIKLLQNELTNKKELIAHYDKQISLLEKQMSSRDHGKGEMTVGTSEMSGLLEEMRHLRQDLERSVNRQNELQIKIDENIRLSRAPREFTFSGRGVSYPDLRLIDASASVNSSENYIITSMLEEKRSRPLGSSTIEFENEQINREKLYAIGEIENHENLRRLIIDIQKQLNAIENKIQEKLRSKSITSTTEPSIEWLEHRLHSLKQCLTLLERIYQIIETYRTTHLPSKINSDERIHNENQELRLSLSKCSQDFQRLKQKYKDQTIHLEQVLAQLTKANYKKSNTDDYLALLLRPTLNNLQKARSNMEHHLKESNNMNYISQKTMQSHRTNHFD